MHTIAGLASEALCGLFDKLTPIFWDKLSLQRPAVPGGPVDLLAVNEVQE